MDSSHIQRGLNAAEKAELVIPTLELVMARSSSEEGTSTTFLFTEVLQGLNFSKGWPRSEVGSVSSVGHPTAPMGPRALPSPHPSLHQPPYPQPAVSQLLQPKAAGLELVPPGLVSSCWFPVPVNH